ncbi:MAG: nucleoside triphosphate pyrophosphatase, partial [Pseudonocardiales bacterium]|nr:nucleoside triphosphate pyrophosphatase [Pseudonocardiales bacterium]
MRLVLASASPARLSVLRAAGLDPLVEVADVDEPALLAANPDPAPGAKVTGLAGAKATTVARRIADAHPDAVVIGCDSMLLIDGELVGKPADVDEARKRWLTMAGRAGELVTGHTVLRMADGEIDRVAEGHAVTAVRFARPTAVELEAYLATGEPLAVAGAFTLDGLGGWFVEGIDGDPSNVIG